MGRNGFELLNLGNKALFKFAQDRDQLDENKDKLNFLAADLNYFHIKMSSCDH